MKLTGSRDVSYWLGCLQKLIADGSCRSPDFLKPFHLITLALALKGVGCTDFKLPDDLTRYAARMDLWEAAGLEAPCAVGRYAPRGRFQPVQALSNPDDVYECAENLSQVFEANSTACSMDSLKITLIELLNNCHDHSDTVGGLCGLACAQSWPAGNLAQIAIADGGIGLRSSLSRNPVLTGRLADENACQLAPEYGITGSPGDHTGYGLTLARDVITLNGGRLIVYSGTEFASFTGNHTYVRNDGQPWTGALIVLEWRTDQPLDVEAVYRNWPLPEGFSDEDFD